MLNFLTKSITKVFGTKSEKDVKELSQYVQATNAAFAQLTNLSHDQLRERTQQLKKRIQEGLASIDTEISQLTQSIEENPTINVDEKEVIFKKVDDLKLKRNAQLEVILLEILPEAFAIVKETARRFKENAQLEVTATHLDRQLAMRKSHIAIDGEKAIWKNEWVVAKAV